MRSWVRPWPKYSPPKGVLPTIPLILHISDRRELDALVREVPEWLEPLLGKFWPGPFTVVLPRSEIVPDIVTAGLDTVAVRLPSLGVARELVRVAGVPIAAPSANLSGRPSPTTAAAVMADMDGRIGMVLDAGPCDGRSGVNRAGLCRAAAGYFEAGRRYPGNAGRVLVVGSSAGQGSAAENAFPGRQA